MQLDETQFSSDSLVSDKSLLSRQRNRVEVASHATIRALSEGCSCFNVCSWLAEESMMKARLLHQQRDLMMNRAHEAKM